VNESALRFESPATGAAAQPLLLETFKQARVRLAEKVVVSIGKCQ
jgi:hypothetical protein